MILMKFVFVKMSNYEILLTRILTTLSVMLNILVCINRLGTYKKWYVQV